ncbi:KCNA3 [Branchiostoma lanceolatum]|uniref:KCNA3 protein n=1 Tax=Branchiostoma lanceolatum TaxID=7740 RepID=A0A8J9YT26_BRALA|nr:KCNA3 [Branchiostoma lanceolatum]
MHAWSQTAVSNQRKKQRQRSPGRRAHADNSVGRVWELLLGGGSMLSRGPGAARGVVTRARPRRFDTDSDATHARGSTLPCPSERVVINVSGLRFVSTLQTLERYPDSLLGDPRRRRWYHDPSRNEFFFDRHRPSFEAILQFYQTGGELKCPQEVPSDVFVAEMEFYDLGEEMIKAFREEMGMELPMPDEIPPPEDEMLLKIWRLFRDPSSSFLAKLVTVTSVLMIIMSVLVTCMETVPDVQTWVHAYKYRNDTNGTLVRLPRTRNPFFVAETIYVAWFTLELVLGFLACSDRVRYSKDYMNILDLVGIILYLVDVCIEISTVNSTGQIDRVVSALWTARLIRILRVVKLTRYSVDMQLFWKAMTNSLPAMVLFTFTTMVLMVVFSGIVFFWESEYPDTKFTSIPDTFWWAIITMINIGYGDHIPQTLVGKIVASVATIAGIVSLCLGIPEFMECYIQLYEAARYSAKRQARRRYGMMSKYGMLGGNKSPFSRKRRRDGKFTLII